MVHRKFISYIVSAYLSLMLLLSGCASSVSQAVQGGANAVSSLAASDKNLQVTMLNVGQADATLIQYKGQNMLIDTGDVDSRDELVKDLQAKGVKTLDIVLITHPHGDHMGGMAALFKAFTIKQLYDNGQSANTAMYKNYLKNIKAKQIPYKALKKGIPSPSAVM